MTEGSTRCSAIGAQGRDIRQLGLSEAFRLIAGGVVSGVVAAFVLSRVLRSFLFEVEPTDPGTMTTVGSVIYQVVRDHYETFVAQTASLRDGDGLPKFIDEEFRGFLRCGWLAGGFGARAVEISLGFWEVERQMTRHDRVLKPHLRRDAC